MSVHRYVDFTTGLDAYWRREEVGGGRLDLSPSGLLLINEDATLARYANAQIDDYHDTSGYRFRWRPPLTLTVRARFSHPAGELAGTAGFGFWNHPFPRPRFHLPPLPRSIWFFYASPPSNMKLDTQTPGHGWKAATFDAQKPLFYLLAPTAPIAMPLMHIPTLYRTFWPIGQRAISVAEAHVPFDMREWHTYRVDWGVRRARFAVDDQVLLLCGTAPRGPLGLVLWLDNRYAVVTPWGEFGFGLLEMPERQWMQVASIDVRPGVEKK